MAEVYVYICLLCVYVLEYAVFCSIIASKSVFFLASLLLLSSFLPLLPPQVSREIQSSGSSSSGDLNHAVVVCL